MTAIVNKRLIAMITLVCGGRTFSDFKFLDQSLRSLNPAPTIIMTGAQRLSQSYPLLKYVGADWLAIEWALQMQIPFIGVPARWTKYGRAAGPIRNVLMLEHEKLPLVDRVIAFPGNNGTHNMIEIAKAATIPVITFGW